MLNELEPTPLFSERWWKIIMKWLVRVEPFLHQQDWASTGFKIPLRTGALFTKQLKQILRFLHNLKYLNWPT